MTMNREDLLNVLRRLKVSRRGDRSALYKPLLLLLLLSRALKANAVSTIYFRDIEMQLRMWIDRFSPTDSSNSVGQPWWHLPTDGLWTVADEHGRVLRESGAPRGDKAVPPLNLLRRQQGNFPTEILELFRSDDGAVLAAINALITRHFGNQEYAIRAELGDAEALRLAPTRFPFNLGQPYKNAGILPRSLSRDPFEVDPERIDRGNQSHASTVDALADFLRRKGVEPLAPESGMTMFDLAWQVNGVVFVAEVKSTTPVNEEKQLRLGIGQVLRYRQQLEARGFEVVAVLVPEVKPTSPGWEELCSSLGIRLVWPTEFVGL